MRKRPKPDQPLWLRLAPVFGIAMGDGLAYDNNSSSYIDAKNVLETLKMDPLVLEAKEGLALTSYTAISTYHALILDIVNLSKL